ncbi:hypothetical protein LR69_04000 [Geobacillus sp. BCO2]|nr:hypothetical protein LR69_04000 [Geobacillus sp. BCO2]
MISINIIESYDDLLKKCVELEYKGNPLASQINKWNLKDKLEKNLFLPPSQEMWELVSGIIEQDNLVKYFKWERDLFKNTINPLQDLIKVLETCKEVAKVDPELFVKCVEFNQIPLRQYFFRVFNMWCKIDIAIEFSTSISTELFYQLEGHGSLTVVPPIPTSDDILKHAPSQVPASW